jgi:hypothetical protein
MSQNVDQMSNLAGAGISGRKWVRSHFSLFAHWVLLDVSIADGKVLLRSAVIRDWD